MAQKVCYLLTSPEKFQQQLSNGCSSGDSHIPTGKKPLATLLQKIGSSSKSANPWPFPLGDPLTREPEEESGTAGETPTDTQKSAEKGVPLSWWKIGFPVTK